MIFSHFGINNQERRKRNSALFLLEEAFPLTGFGFWDRIKIDNMTTQTAKVKNGEIRIALPKKLRKTWKGADVFVFPAEDSLLLKRIQKPLAKLSDLASRISSSKMSQKEINKEIQAGRKNK